MQTTLSIGTELKSPTIRYRIEAMLGQGAFGVTYKAKGFTIIKGALGEMTMEMPQPIAIKEFFMRDINQRGVSGEVMGMAQGSLVYNYSIKFRKEAENLAKMKHPNIVKVIDFIEANNTFYYVMEYVDACRNIMVKMATLTPLPPLDWERRDMRQLNKEREQTAGMISCLLSIFMLWAQLSSSC